MALIGLAGPVPAATPGPVWPARAARRFVASLLAVLLGPVIVPGPAASASVTSASVTSARAAPPPGETPGGIGLAWGYGVTGDWTDFSSTVPIGVDLPSGTRVTAFAAGFYHILAVTSTGAVLAWGENSAGQLGDGTVTYRFTPVRVLLPAGTRVVAVAAGVDYSLAVTSTGAVLAWGENYAGQLGDGTTARRNVPVPVELPEGVTVVGVAAAYEHSLAVSSTGRVFAWGANRYGQLGDGTDTDRRTPVAVDLPAGTAAVAVAANDHHSLAVTSTGVMLGWGFNGSGVLGDGTYQHRRRPVPVALPAGTTVTAIAAGFYHSLAVTSTGAMFGWGANGFGAVGDGTYTHRNVPVPVALPPGTTVRAVAAGEHHSLALTADGGVLSWGFNVHGQLGDGTNSKHATPAGVHLPAGIEVTGITAGYGRSFAIATPPTSRSSLRVSPTEPRPDQRVTFTATVACTVAASTGSVTFLDGVETLGSATLAGASTTGTAGLTVDGLGPGRHSIRARYEGNSICPAAESSPVTVVVALPILPVTGAGLPAAAATGGLLILVGVALLLAAGRRRRRFVGRRPSPIRWLEKYRGSTTPGLWRREQDID